MNPIDPSKFSLDYLIENKVITILSQDYVIEHGTNWDEVELEEITSCYKDYMCYRDNWGNPDYGRLFSGVLFETWGDLNIDYYRHYKEGLRDGIEVHFHDSGKVRSYGVWNNSRLVGKVFGWYENGKIEFITVGIKKRALSLMKMGKLHIKVKGINTFSAERSTLWNSLKTWRKSKPCKQNSVSSLSA